LRAAVNRRTLLGTSLTYRALWRIRFDGKIVLFSSFIARHASQNHFQSTQNDVPILPLDSKIHLPSQKPALQIPQMHATGMQGQQLQPFGAICFQTFSLNVKQIPDFEFTPQNLFLQMHPCIIKIP